MNGGPGQTPLPSAYTLARPLLLLLDGHASHHNPRVLRIAGEKDINVMPATPYHTSLPAPRQRLALVPKEPLERGMRAADDVMKVSLGIYIPMHACMSHIGAITCALAAIPSFSHALQKYSCLLHSRNGSELVTIPTFYFVISDLHLFAYAFVATV